MKIYLQDCQTLKFIRCDSSWGSDISEALDFLSVRRATLYGLQELKDLFQLLQVDSEGLQSRVPTLVGQLPAVKSVANPRPARAARAVCVAREILKRTGIWRNQRPTARILPPMLPMPRQIPWAADLLNGAISTHAH